MGNTDSNPNSKRPNPQYSANRNPPRNPVPQPRFQKNPPTPQTQNHNPSSVQEELITWEDIDKFFNKPTTNPPVTEKPPPTVMATEAIETKLDDLNINEKKEINILLLGETGAGKSTFINSVFNYLQFEDFDKAQNGFVKVLIRANFPITDKDGVRRVVDIGPTDDANENLVTGASATQGVKTYSFHIRTGNTLVRLIDTPGMGDTRGPETDHENCENILQYISRLHQLHAICYLARSEQSRITVYFEYCVNQILSRLEKSACKNIIFVFTYSKDSGYHPGETYELLKNIIDRIRKNPAHAEIPLGPNAFCFDNEAFRNLVAIKKGVKLSDHMIKSSVESWNRSTAQCWQMISYISDLKPHMVHNTSAVNEARRIIYQLAQPMADIAQLVNDNIQILRNHQRNLDYERLSLTELRKKLYIPVIDLVVTNLTQPVTVCTDLSCSEAYKVGDRNEWHYKTRCHDPCFLTNVPRDLIGSPELMSCAAMGGTQYCTKCTHSYKLHMHVYYMTKKEQKQQKDDTISKNIDTREQGIQRGKVVMREIQERKNLLEVEMKTIVRCNAKFAHFLSHNAIAAYSDSYADYIRYLKEQEKHLGADADLGKLTGLETLLREHEETKKVFLEAAKWNEKLGKSDEITPQEIAKTKQELFNLKINGKKIRELFESQTKSLKKEYKFTEYIHEGVFQQAAPKKLKDDGAKKSQSSASNPTQKFQRGRGVNRGNFNNNRGRGKSAGPQNRNQRDRTPPPSYTESSRNPPRENLQTQYPPPLMTQNPTSYDYYRGRPAPPPATGYPRTAYEPPPRPAYEHPPRPAYEHPPRPAYEPPPRPYEPLPASGAAPRPRETIGARPDDPQAKIQVNVTYAGPPHEPQPTSPRDPPPRDYREYPERRDYPVDPRDYPRDYPPYPDRREYPPHPRDHPLYQDPRDYPPHPRDYAYPDRRDHPREYARDPYYPPPPPAPAADPYYRHDPRYPDPRPPPPPNYYPNEPQRNRPYNNQRSSRDDSQNSNRGRQFVRGGQNNYNNNYRGNNRGGRGGIHRKNRRRNDKNANSNSGDESDTSVASSNRR